MFVVRAFMQCPLCGKPITEDQVPHIERDHIQPLGLGGEDTAENSQFAHARCHSRKTHEEDRPIMHKADRQAGKTGQMARRKRRGGSSIKTRPMDGSKASAWKKKMDGTVERRT